MVGSSTSSRVVGYVLAFFALAILVPAVANANSSTIMFSNAEGNSIAVAYSDPNLGKTYTSSGDTTQLFMTKSCTFGVSGCGTTFMPTYNGGTGLADSGGTTQLVLPSPEPTSLLMMGTGFLGAGFLGRFKAKLNRG